MKSLFPLSVVLLIAGCFNQPQSARIDAPSIEANASAATSYTVLKDAPDAILDEIQSKYSSDIREWRNKWKQDNSTTPIDGQRTIQLLEIACYADVMCHPVEYPLRVATHEYVRDHLNVLEVRESLNWIQSFYNSGLPVGTPGDGTGEFKGVLVESMNIRMKKYVKNLLQSPETTVNRK